jgi:hypothetical protein
MQTWSLQTQSQFVPLSMVSSAIPYLPIYSDGLQCQISPLSCQFIGRGKESIRYHWRQVHQWSAGIGRGRSTKSRKKEIEDRFNTAAKHVYCQRVFIQGEGSRYFAIESTATTTQPSNYVADESAWKQAWSKATEYYNEVQKKASETIAEGEADEVNPWLRRTGWVQYLDGYHHEQILRLVQQPTPYDKDAIQAGEGNEFEPLESTIWQAMADIARISQSSVKASGIMLRMHAVRTEKDQVCYQPLQPY